MILIGMLFDKGDNKVVIPYYLYRWTTANNTSNFYLYTTYDNMIHGVDVPADLFHDTMRGSFKEWFETI